jgi:hypothetical protein
VKYILYLIAVFALFACSTKAEQSIPKAEKKEIIYPEFLTKSVSKLDELTLPFTIDSLYFLDTTRSKKLRVIPIEEVEFLSKNLHKEEASDANRYYINDYLKIKNAKLDHQYEAFKKKLDIGMIQDAECYYLGKIDYPDSLAIILWELDYNSYEACPYFSGKHVMASLIYDGTVVETIEIAGYETNVDPPMDAKNLYTCSINQKGLINRHYLFNVNEEEVSIEKGTKREQFRITKKGFIQEKSK